MGGCPECDASIEESADLIFQDVGSTSGVLSLQTAKRFYVTACANCGAVVGTGVAGAA
jgi:predicted nucleic-acid-binding Zn-ribbon protein